MDTIAMVQRIEQLLAQQNMLKKEFYDMVPIKSSSVSHWRTGRNKPTLANIYRMAEILGCSPSYLMTGADEDEAEAQAEEKIETEPGSQDVEKNAADEKKELAPMSESELNDSIIKLFGSLSEDERRQVMAFASGLVAARKH